VRGGCARRRWRELRRRNLTRAARAPQPSARAGAGT
jgi:hypothetical protein